MERATGDHAVYDANWCEQHAAERDMGRDWTGRSIFTEGVCSHEVPKSAHNILKAVARRKPVL
eukprot:11170435-Lingulodinium_polyedra.AAC.1